MPAFYMDATLYTLDDAAFKKFTKKWQEQVMRGGVRQFLRACLARIPKRTGFLRGAFSDIRREYGNKGGGRGGSGEGEANLLGDIFGQGTRRRVNPSEDDPRLREARIQALMKKHAKHRSKTSKGTGKAEYYTASVGGKGSKIRKTPGNGVQFATKAADVLKFTDNVATFFLDVTISYYRINDFYSRIKGAPWRSMMEGGSAMANWLGRAADMFPQITEIMAKQKIVLRGSRITKTVDQQVVAQRLLDIKGLAGFDDGGPIPAGPAGAGGLLNSKRALQKARLLAGRKKKNIDYRQNMLKRGEYQKKLKEAGIEPKRKKGE